MKLTKLHLFLIIITVLIASTLGFSVKEYFENKDTDSKGDKVNKALKYGSNYDPFGSGSGSGSDDSEQKTSDKKSYDGEYDTTINDLEDIIVPGRRERKHHHDSKGNHWKKHTDQMAPEESNNNNGSKSDSTDSSQASCGHDMSQYILKSEVVPPVCPKCPDSRSCPRPKPCPSCPPCARCPEPAFECKKVPNYNAISASNVSNILPMPRLNSFAQFN